MWYLLILDLSCFLSVDTMSNSFCVSTHHVLSHMASVDTCLSHVMFMKCLCLLHILSGHGVCWNTNSVTNLLSFIAFISWFFLIVIDYQM